MAVATLRRAGGGGSSDCESRGNFSSGSRMVTALVASHGQFPLWGFIVPNWSPFVRVNDIPDAAETRINT